MKLLVLCFLLPLTLTLRLYRLSTKGIVIFKESQTLYSTLGTFRVKLKPGSCQLAVEEFTGNEYRIKGYFPEKAFKLPCQHFQLKQGLLITSHQVPILRIRNRERKTFSETTFTIDDLGILRLSCFSNNIMGLQSNAPQETWISLFRTPKKYVYATNNIQVDSSDAMSLRIGETGWGMSARNGLLSIFHINDPTKIIRYRYKSFRINPGLILDADNHELPAANFQGLHYEPRCQEVKVLNFQFPLVFESHPSWPELRVLDQGGYEILHIRYPTYNCIKDLNIHEIEGQNQCQGWVCPGGTFQHLGQCVLNCPKPYFHQINSKGKNRCVLNCQEGSNINETSRICSCNSDQVTLPTCSRETHPWPMGCFCSGSTFYNGVSCLQGCPMGQIGLRLPSLMTFSNNNRNNYNQFIPEQFGNICIRCPYKCLICQRSPRPVSTYLVCRTCVDGYTLFEGVCKKQCPSSSFCGKQCAIEFCEKCTKENIVMQTMSLSRLPSIQALTPLRQTCLECSRPNILFRNTCIKKCPNGFILKISKTFHFSCQAIAECNDSREDNNVSGLAETNNFKMCQKCNYLDDVCWINCEMGSYFNNASNCYCMVYSEETENIAYGYKNACEPQIKLTQCPLNHYMNQNTSECLPCPFGCLTCVTDMFGFIECTSCAPSYFLMVDLNWTHYCQRDTTLTSCEVAKQNPVQRRYSSKDKVCGYSLNSQSQVYSSRVQRNKCKENDLHCLTCLQQSSSSCTLCKQGHFLYNSKCVPICPIGTIQFQRVCLYNKVLNCQQPTVVQDWLLMNISQETMDQQAYTYFLPSAFSRLNRILDPIGNIFLYANLYSRNVGSRITYIPVGRLQCKECLSGYGYNPHSSACQSCAASDCRICGDSLSQFCLECHPGFKVNVHGNCIQISLNEIQCQEGQFRNQSNVCIDSCQGYKIDYEEELPKNQFQINCSFSCISNSNVKRRVQIQSESQSYLLCIVNKQSQEENSLKTQNLLLTGSNMDLGKMMLVSLVPIQKPFHIDQNMNNSIHLFSFQKSEKQSLFGKKPEVKHIQIRPDRILVLYESTPLITIRLNPKHFRSQSKTSIIKTQQFANKKYIRQPPHELDVNNEFNENEGDTLFLAQAQYTMLSDSKYIREWGIDVVSMLLVLASMSVSAIFLAQQIDYKTDNMIIYMQTLTLFALSSNVHLLNTSFYQFLMGFKFICGIWGTSLGNRVIQTLEPGFLQHSPTATLLFFGDNNIVRNCLPMIILIACLVPLYFLMYHCFETQELLFWRSVDRQQIRTQDHAGQKIENNSIQFNLPLTVSSLNNSPLNSKKSGDNRRKRMRQIYKNKGKQPSKSTADSNLNTNTNSHQSQNKIKKKNRMSNNKQVNSDKTQNNIYHNKSISIVDRIREIRQSITWFMNRTNKPHRYNPKDIGHFKAVECIICFLWETSSLPLLYFSMIALSAQVVYSSGAKILTLSQVLGIIFSVLFVLYTSIKLAKCDQVSGIYMIKRIWIAVVFAFTISSHLFKTAILLIIGEFLFTIGRIVIQGPGRPKISTLVKQNIKQNMIPHHFQNHRIDEGYSGASAFADEQITSPAKPVQKEKSNKSVEKNLVSIKKINLLFSHPACILITQQMLLIISYICLSLIDKMSEKTNQTNPRSLHWSFAFVIIITLVVICGYLVLLILDLISQLLEESSPLSSYKQKKNQKINDMSIFNAFVYTVDEQSLNLL